MSIEMRSILLALISGMALHWYSEGNAAYALGRTVGSLVIPFTVAYFFSKGRPQQVKSAAFSIAAVIVIGIASVPFYKAYNDQQTAKEAANRISKIVDAQEALIASSGHAATPSQPATQINGRTTTNPSVRIAEVFANYKEQEFALTKAFRESPEVTRLNPVLGNYSSFASLSGLQQLRSTITAYERRYALYTRELNALTTNFAANIRSALPTSQSVDAFDRGFSQSKARSERLVAIENEMLALYRSSADLLEPLTAFGKVSVGSDGQLLIDNEAVRAKFNQNLQKMQALGIEQENLEKQMIAAQRAVVDSLRGM